MKLSFDALLRVVFRRAILVVVVAALGGSIAGAEEAKPPQREIDATEIRQWIEALGANEFATRERAADALASLGLDAVPLLEQAHQETADPEIKLRAQKLIQQLRSGNQEAKIESFLAGDDVDFENWGIIREVFGDSPKSRDLFVELLRTYPELVSSLAGTTRELVVAMDSVTAKLNANQTKNGWQPRVSDAVALLLPTIHENVPVSVAYENKLLFLMQLSPINRVGKDNILGQPFLDLVSSWMDRSQLANRQDVLCLAMEWDLERVYPLARRTLSETTDTETLSHAMQVIAKYGTKTDTAFLWPLIADSRPASERRFVRGRAIETQLGDVAVAAIAILNDVPMKEIGLDDSVKDEKYGFLYEEVGFASGDQEKRIAARKRIEQVIVGLLNDAGQGS